MPRPMGTGKLGISDERSKKGNQTTRGTLQSGTEQSPIAEEEPKHCLEHGRPAAAEEACAVEKRMAWKARQRFLA